jgi:hypothetical protein
MKKGDILIVWAVAGGERDKNVNIKINRFRGLCGNAKRG